VSLHFTLHAFSLGATPLHFAYFLTPTNFTFGLSKKIKVIIEQKKEGQK